MPRPTLAPAVNPTTQAPIKLPTTPSAPAASDEPLVRFRTGDGSPKLDMQGDTLVMGHMSDDELGFQSGAVYSYQRSIPGEAWSRTQTLRASDGGFRQWFGLSVDLDGKTLAVGGRNSVYIFDRASPQAEWTEQQILFPSTSTSESIGGVSLDGNTLVVGCAIDDAEFGNRSATGTVHVFSRSDEGAPWSERQVISRNDNEGFGFSANVGGNTLVVGTYHENKDVETKVYVFERASALSDFVEQAEFVLPFNDKIQRNGLATADGVVVVGAQAIDFERSGTAFVYGKVDNTWMLQAQLEHSNVGIDYRFGSMVAMEAGTIAVGTFASGVMAYIFTASNNVWTQQMTLSVDRGGVYHSTYGLAISGSTVAATMYNGDGGYAYIYELN